MPALTNQKHEIFCKKLIEAATTGKSQGWAYQQSGYDCTTPAADVAATRLLKSAKVQARLTELSEPAAKKARTTVDTLTEQFDAVFEGAMGSAQFGAAGSAAAAKSKLLGFMRERVEIGAPGAFSACESPRDLVREMLKDQTPAEALAALDALREAIEQHAGERAIMLPAT
jgi:hypothetical protein